MLPETPLQYKRITTLESFNEYEEFVLEGIKSIAERNADLEPEGSRRGEIVTSLHNPDFFLFIYFNENGSLGGMSVSKVVRSPFNKIMLLEDVYAPNYEYSGQILEFVYNIAMKARCTKVALVLARNAKAFDKLIQNKTFLKSKLVYQFMILEEK